MKRAGRGEDGELEIPRKRIRLLGPAGGIVVENLV